jgi:hypothetical protein
MTMRPYEVTRKVGDEIVKIVVLAPSQRVAVKLAEEAAQRRRAEVSA